MTFYLVKNTLTDEYLSAIVARRSKGLWTSDPQSFKVALRLRDARASVACAVHAHRQNRSDIVIEEYTATSQFVLAP